MRQPAIVAAMGMALAVVSLYAFGLNYNASKSNTGNIVVHPTSVSDGQAAAILADLDKGKQAPTEASVKQYMKAHGVQQGAIKQIVIENTGGKTTVILLDDPGDLVKARAVIPAR